MPDVDPSWLSIFNSFLLLGGIAGVYLKYSSWRASEEKRARDQLESQRRLIMAVCREFVNTAEYRERQEKRITEVSASTIDRVFRERAVSFVSAERYDAEARADERRLSGIESSIKENTMELGRIGGKITGDVTSQVIAYLANAGFTRKRE